MAQEKDGKTEKELFFFFERLKTTSAIKRFGTLPMLQFESVASHSFNVAMIALLIADYEENKEINIETLMRKALLHDFEESILSDIPHSIKHRYKGGELARLLKNIVPDLIKDEIFKELPEKLMENYIMHSQKAKEGIEGHIIEAADAMDTVVSSVREIKMGNRYFEKVFRAGMDMAKRHSEFRFVALFLRHAEDYYNDSEKVFAERI